MKDSSENSSELEQKKFSFDFRPGQERSESIAEASVAETVDSADSASPEVTAPVDASIETPEAELRGCLPGGVLAAERQRRGFSVADIANQLFLTEKQISALEADDYDHFPAPIFVTGYLRNYARLLDLPPDPLIELFNSQSTQTAPELDRAYRTTDRVGDSKGVFDSRIVMAVIASFVLVGVLWLGMSSESDVATVDDAEVVDDFSIVTSEPLTTVTTGSVESELETIEMAPPKKTIEPVKPVEVVKVAPAAANSVSEEVLDTVPEFIADRAAAQSFPDSMVLTFSAESWVEITDANERRVMFDLGKPGQTRALSGTAPFKILFGYSPAVKMTFNGEPFDQSSLARGKVAKFTLGNDAE